MDFETACYWTAVIANLCSIAQTLSVVAWIPGAIVSLVYLVIHYDNCATESDLALADAFFRILCVIWLTWIVALLAFVFIPDQHTVMQLLHSGPVTC